MYRKAWVHMSNSISHKGEDVSMQNGLTEVFIVTVGLSGSELAKSDYEKDLVVWLLEKDQDFVGRGTVGFDLCEMPWSRKDIHKQKMFLIQAANGVKTKTGWNKLSYTPNEKWLFDSIDDFIRLVESFCIADVDERHRLKWIENGNPLYRLGHGAWVRIQMNGVSTIRCDWVDAENPLEIKGYLRCPICGLYLTFFGCYLCKDECELNEKQ